MYRGVVLQSRVLSAADSQWVVAERHQGKSFRYTLPNPNSPIAVAFAGFQSTRRHSNPLKLYPPLRPLSCPTEPGGTSWPPTSKRSTKLEKLLPLAKCQG